MQSLHAFLERHFYPYKVWHTIPLINPVHFVLLGLFITTVLVLPIFDHLERLDNQVALVGLAGKSQAATTRANQGQFLKSMADFLAATPEQKKQLQPSLVAAAKARKASNLEILKNRPEDIQNIVFITPVVANRLPQEIQNHIEKKVALSGALLEGHWHNEETTDSGTEYFFNQGKGKLERVFFKEEGVHRAASEVKIDAYEIDSGMYVSEATNYEVSADSYSDGADYINSIIKTVGVVLFNFSNNNAEPVTKAQVKQTYYTDSNSAREYHLANSFGKYKLQGKKTENDDIWGYYTIQADTSICNTTNLVDWGSKARNTASNSGVDLTGYDYISHIMPETKSCNWSGYALTTCTNGVCRKDNWINGLNGFNWGTIAHEFGHNLLPHHAGSYRCIDSSGNPVTLSNNCTFSEYGNPFDIMGWYNRQMDSFHKAILEAISSSNIQTITTSDTYSVKPINSLQTGIQSLRIPKTTSSDTVLDYYYIDFRQPAAFDPYQLKDPISNGVTVYIAPCKSGSVCNPADTNATNNSKKSILLDMVPTTSTFNDAPLTVGKVFYDVEKNLSIKLLSVSATEAKVQVAFGSKLSEGVTNSPTTSCTDSNPAVTISPTSQSGSAGSALSYTISVTNKDSSACNIKTFTVTAGLPTGFTQSPSSISLSLAPGSTKSVTIAITSPSNAAAATYNFNQTAANSSYSAKATASYTILASSDDYTPSSNDTTAPELSISGVSDGQTLNSRGNTNVTASASDASGISEITIDINGTEIRRCINTTSCTHKWNMRDVSAGTYNITATAKDKVGNTANQSIITIKN